MRNGFFVWMVVLALGMGQALAQEGEDSAQTKVLEGSRSLMATPDDGAQSSGDVAGSDEDDGAQEDEPTTCTAADRQMLEEHNKLMIAYYEDSKYMSEHFNEIKSIQEFDQFRQNADVYMAFFASKDYQKSHKLRELCDYPAPPIDTEWPSFFGIPSPFSDLSKMKDPL
jgi:hypothetical protein